MDVKFFRFGGDDIAFDPSTASLFAVDREGRKVLRGAGRPSSAADAELRDLKRRGFFRDHACPSAKPSPVDVRRRIQSITLGLTHECNLRCSYCFGQRYLQPQPEPKAQLLAVGRACLGLLHENWRRSREAAAPPLGREPASCAEAPSEASYNLVFFGGEPLLRFNVLTELVDYGQELFQEAPDRLSFGITTNALELDEEKAIWLRDHGLTPLVSVDGFGEAHDSYRRDTDGNGSFEKIKENLERARRLGLPFGARVTITNQNVDLVGMMEQLDPIGFFNYKFCPLCGGDRYALTSGNQRRLAWSYRELGDLFLDRLKRGEPIRFDAFDHYLDALANCRATSWCCDAGANEISVNPRGEVFSCYKLAAEPEATMGSIWDDVLYVHRPNLDHADRVERIPACSRCWIRHVCAGGCFADRHVSAKYRQSACFKAHCNLNRVVMAEAIRIYDLARRDCPGRLQEFTRERS